MDDKYDDLMNKQIEAVTRYIEEKTTCIRIVKNAAFILSVIYLGYWIADMVQHFWR